MKRIRTNALAAVCCLTLQTTWVCAQTPTIYAPNGGELYAVDAIESVEFEPSGGPYRIELSLDGGTTYEVLVDDYFGGPLGGGRYYWTPAAGHQSTQCLVKVTDHNTQVSDTSDAPFTIANTVRLLGIDRDAVFGTPLHINEPAVVRWFASSIFNALTIDLSLDGGATFATIAQGVSSPTLPAHEGSYCWIVEPHPTPNAVLRLVSSEQPEVFVDSEPFAIVALPAPRPVVEEPSDLVADVIHVPPLAASAIIRVPADQPTIAAAIAAALPGDTILIAQDTYLEHDLLIDKDLTLEGEDGAEATVIDGQGNGILEIASGTVELIGLKFVGGTATGPSWETGAVTNFGALTAHDCVFDNNNAWSLVAGIGGVSTEVLDCTFSNNSNGFRAFNGSNLSDCTFTDNGGVGVQVEASASLTRCRFTGQSTAIRAWGSTGVDDCTIEQNGQGIIVDLGSLDLTDSAVVGNGSGIGVGIGGATITGSVIANNSGIGLWLGGSSCYSAGEAIVNHSTIAANGTNVSMHEVECFGDPYDDAELTLGHSIVSHGADGQIVGDASEHAIVRCSLVHGPNQSFVGVCTTIDDDPLFCDPEGGDFRVFPGSPALTQECGVMGAFSKPCDVTAIAPTESADVMPLHAYLGVARPNPFNPSTRVSFGLEAAGRAELRVYDLGGRLVRLLVDQVLEAGVHEVIWDGRDSAGQPVASGLYFVRMETPGFHGTQKLALVK